MPIAAVNRQPDIRAIVRDDPEKLLVREPNAALRVKLSPLDKLALDGLVDPRDFSAIVSMVEDSATALSGFDRHEVRVRLVSRAVAAERARMLILQGMLDERLTARDLDGAAEVDRLLLSTTRRLAILLGEHRAACSAGHRPTVVVGHADAVHVEGADR
jgi:hypothetical protein